MAFKIIFELNASLRYFNDHYPIRDNEIDVTVTLAAGVSTYDFSKAPNSLSYWRASRIGTTPFKNLATGYVIQPLTKSQFIYNPFESATSTSPTSWTNIGSNKVKFYPTPSVHLQLSHSYVPSNYCTDSLGAPKGLVTVGSDLILIDDQFFDMVMYKTVAKVRSARSRDEQSLYYEAQAMDLERAYVNHQNSARSGTNALILSERLDLQRNRFFPFGTRYDR